MSPKLIRKVTKLDTGQPQSNNNYYSPLQALDDTTETEGSNAEISAKKKTFVPPITVLTTSKDQVDDMCKLLNTQDYSIRQISIGVKLHCTNIKSFETLCTHLKSMKHECFSTLFISPDFQQINSVSLTNRNAESSCHDLLMFMLKHHFKIKNSFTNRRIRLQVYYSISNHNHEIYRPEYTTDNIIDLKKHLNRR